MKRITIIIISMMMIITSVIADYENHPARDSIQYLYDLEIIKGYDNGEFGSENPVTRAEFMAIINRSFKFNKQSNISFSDVKETDWFYNDVRQAVFAKYMLGYEDNTMRPHDNITRQEAAVIMNRILDIAPDNINNIKNVPGWCREAVNNIISKNLMEYNSKVGFRPNEYLTRAEMARLIHRSLVQGIPLKVCDLTKKYVLSHSKIDGITLSVYDVNKIKAEGVTFNSDHKWVTISINDYDDLFKLNKNRSQVFDNKINVISNPIEDNGKYNVEIFFMTEEKGYLHFFNSVRLNVNNKNLEFEVDPIFEHNYNKYNIEKDVLGEIVVNLNKEDYGALQDLVTSITRNIEDKYKQVYTITNWVSENIYYDSDGKLELGKANTKHDAMGTYYNKKSVCQGYAELTHALLGVAGFHSRIVLGYALGAGTQGEELIKSSGVNHAWNEVFVDDRWIIVDTTWNSRNRYKKGEYKRQDPVSTYFDLSLEALSATHKIVEYR